jgi:predicted metalloprotease
MQPLMGVESAFMYMREVHMGVKRLSYVMELQRDCFGVGVGGDIGPGIQYVAVSEL